MSKTNTILPAISIFAFTILVGTMSGPSITQAAEKDHDAHQHGIGGLNIAFQGNEVEIEIEIPAEDVVGFEYEPKSKSEKDAVKNAVSKLKQGNKIFIFPAAAKCTLEKAEIASALIEDHDVGHKEDHHDHGDKDHKDEEAHSEFEATYHFECENPGKVTYLDVEFFKFFPSTQKLSAQFITSKGQGAQSITPKSTRVAFN